MAMSFLNTCILLFLTSLKIAASQNLIKGSIIYELIFSDSILSDLQNSYIPCFLLADKDNIYGCNGDFSGNVGQVEFFDQIKEKKFDQGQEIFEAEKISLKDVAGKILVIDHSKFDREIVDLLLSEKDLSKTVAGVILDHSNSTLKGERPTNYNADESCPNGKLGLYGYNNYEPTFDNCQTGPAWNDNQPFDFTKTYFPFPIFLIQNSTYINDIKSCYTLTKNTSHKCTIKLKLMQHMSSPAETCLLQPNAEFDNFDDERCKALGGSSVYSQLVDTREEATENDNQIKKQNIWVTTKIDSKNLFWEYAPGQSDLGSIVVLLSMIEGIGRALKGLGKEGKKSFLSNLDKNVVFSFLDAESYGYISSQYFVDKLEKGDFPLKQKNEEDDEEDGDDDSEDTSDSSETKNDTTNELGKNLDGPEINPQQYTLENIDTVFEIGEIYPIINDFNSNYFLHFDNTASNVKKNKELSIINDISTAATESNPAISIKRPVEDQPLPPSSLHSFKRANNNISAILVTDFEKHYNNLHLSSTFDIFSEDEVDTKILSDDNIKKFSEISVFLAKSVMNLAKPGSTFSITPNKNFTKSLLECFFKNPECTEFKSVFPADMRGLNQPEEVVKTLQKIKYRYAGTFSHSVQKYHADNHLLANIIMSLISKHLGEKIDELDMDTAIEMNEVAVKDLCKIDNVNDNSIQNTMFYDLNTRKFHCYKTPFLKIYSTVSPGITFDAYARTNGTNKNLPELERYSTFSESMWDAKSFKFEMFYTKDGVEDYFRLFGGLVFFGLIYFVNFTVNSKFDVLFGGCG